MSDTDLYEQCWNKFQERILGFLKKLAAAVGDKAEEPWDDDSAEHSYWLTIRLDDQQKNWLDVRFTLADSGDRDTGEYWQRGNWLLDIVEHGGAIVGGICPHNYTSRVWVEYDNEREFDRRLRGIENSIYLVMKVIREWIDEKQAADNSLATFKPTNTTGRST